MIQAVMVINTLGKPRLSRFYYSQPQVEQQHRLMRHVYAVLSNRSEKATNFVQLHSAFGVDSGLVYKHYTTLYFVIVFDRSENGLAMLDLIQDVCELDMLFNYIKMQTIVDEIDFGGQVLETDPGEVIKAAEEISRLEGR